MIAPIQKRYQGEWPLGRVINDLHIDRRTGKGSQQLAKMSQGSCPVVLLNLLIDGWDWKDERQIEGLQKWMSHVLGTGQRVADDHKYKSTYSSFCQKGGRPVLGRLNKVTSTNLFRNAIQQKCVTWHFTDHENNHRHSHWSTIFRWLCFTVDFWDCHIICQAEWLDARALCHFFTIMKMKERDGRPPRGKWWRTLHIFNTTHPVHLGHSN